MAATFVAMPTKLANVVRISEKDASQTYLQNVKGCTWVLASTAGGPSRTCVQNHFVFYGSGQM